MEFCFIAYNHSFPPGKERIVEGIAKVLDCKICVNQTKMNLIKMQENKELTSRLSKNINSRLHIGKKLNLHTAHF